MLRTVAALCVAPNSLYKSMQGVDAFDKARDVRTFAGGCPVVAHPPCRAWSAFCAHQAKPEPGEKELGFLCVEHLKREGGVLEHPAHSRLFEAAGLPMPGKRRGDLFTVPVLQAWWGYPLRKETWLCVAGVGPRLLEIPYCEHDSSAGEGDSARWVRMSKHQRAATCDGFGRWLVDVARASAFEVAACA